MAPDTDHEVVYTFIAEDRISSPMKKAEEQLRRTAEATGTAATAQQEATARTPATIEALQRTATAAQEAGTAGGAVIVNSAQVLESMGATGTAARNTAAQLEALQRTAEGTAGAVTASAGAHREAGASADRAAASMTGASAASAKAGAGAKAARTELDLATASAERNQAAQQTAILKSVETLSAMHALQSGVSAITSSVRTLGIVDEETALTLQKVTAGIQLVVGTAEAVKGVTTLFNALNATLKTTAIVSTFAALAENPARGLAIVGGASLAAGAVGGYLMSTTNNTTNTTINVQHESTARTVAGTVDTGSWY